MRELLQMERKGRGRELQLLANRPGGQAFRALLDEQAKDREPMLLRQGGQRVEGGRRFHVSNNMETKRACQAPPTGAWQR